MAPCIAWRQPSFKRFVFGSRLPESCDCQSRLRQRFEPREIEDVVITAADELDAAVAGLDGGEVAVVLGAGVADREYVAVDAVRGALFSAGSNETLVRPSFAVVRRKRYGPTNISRTKRLELALKR
jgi:hypothetical protein